jgi:hypothetical protein
MAAAAAVAVGALVCLAPRLAVPPLHPEETKLSLAASEIAAVQSRDDVAPGVPLFVRTSSGEWFLPVPVYAAATLRALSPTTNVRWTAVIFGAIDVALMFVVAERLFASRGLGLLAAALLLCTPAHVTYSRLAVHAGLWHLPFTLAWLIAVGSRLDTSRPGVRGSAFAFGAALLAASIYTQPFAAFMVPIFGIIGVAAVARAQRFSHAVLTAGAASLIVVLPALLWFARFPASYAATFGEWAIHPAHVSNPIYGVTNTLHWFSIATSAKVWWDFFSPGHLAVNPSAPALAGVFLTPVALLAAVGCYASVTTTDQRRQRMMLVIVAFFLCSPLVAATYKDPRVLSRGLMIIPAGVLLAVAGVDALWSARARWWRPVAAGALALAALQFLVWLVRGQPA